MTIAYILVTVFFAYILYTISIKDTHKKSTGDIIQKTKTPSKAHGIIFGKKHRSYCYSPTENEGHAVVFGGSGSGKTSAIVIPTIRAWRNGTCFAIDISGDIHTNVSKNNMLLYNPEDSTIPYNIFGFIDKMIDTNEQDLALERLGLLLMPPVSNSSANSEYFRKGGLDILVASLIAFYHEGLDFIEIIEKVNDLDYKKLFSQIDKTENVRAIRHISRFSGEHDSNTSGCKGNACEAISLFAYDETLKKSIRRPKPEELCFEPAMIETNNLFLILSQKNLGVYSPLIKIFTSQLLEYLSDRPKEYTHNILLCLDEFATLGKIDIGPPLRTFRKKHVRIMIITQSMADLDEIYGKTTRTALLNNFQFKIILSCTDVETQRYFADLIGQAKTEHTTTTRNNTGLFNPIVSVSSSQQKEYIIEPSDLANMGKELIVIYPGGHIKLEKNFYFKK